jgi:dTDP-4-dehydrorhamnose reductase
VSHHPHAEPLGSPDRLELWGGLECTVNRVGDAWFDQTARSGHQERIGDLALFAGLGIRKLRYPALWERISPDDPEQRDFSWTDERLPEIKRLGMEPILTLCHHGSGPRHTSLVDDNFAEGLARHAAAVAERYPWVEDYTPVNEPLTTARFSALYGFWYPHSRDETAFWTALLNETDATRLAMREIRRINPAARLIQTDDLGFCHATGPLRGQAEFENARRWMGWDLLCGIVMPGHSLWERLVSRGFEDRLRAIADDPCPPDVIGINHYLSSERLLDHRLDLHSDRDLADCSVGNCNGVAHVDVDAARRIPEEVIGLSALLEQAWERYGRPIAITECHLGTTREDQARWFVDTWERAEGLRERGVDVRAVTAWSLLGSHDWNRMVTRFVGHYEPGVFDVRGGQPRPTLMAQVLRELAHGRTPQTPALQVRGWWHAERRAMRGERVFEMRTGPRLIRAPQPLLLISDGGPMARLAIAACEARGLHYIVSDRDDALAVRIARPWAVLDTRRPRPDDGGAALGEVCHALGITGAFFADATLADQQSPAGTLVAVSGEVFTLEDENCDALALFEAIDRGRPLAVSDERLWDASYGPCLVDSVIDLLLDGATGVFEMQPGERWSEAQFADALALVAGATVEGRINPESAVDLGQDEIVSYLPPTETMLDRFVRERRAQQRHERQSRGALNPPRARTT